LSCAQHYFSIFIKQSKSKKMKKSIQFATIVAVGLFLHGCKKNEVNTISETSPTLSKTFLSAEKPLQNCNFIDGGWGPDAYEDGTLIDAANTNFINGQHAAIAGVWGQNLVPLTFAHNEGVLNAYSYSSPRKIIYGELLYNYAVSQDGYAATAYILAHEWGHQLQFNYGLPTVTGYENMELEADGFGGYYMARPVSGYGDWASAASAANFANKIGGGDHGTNAQRRSAVRLGWSLGHYYNLNVQQFDAYFFYNYQAVLNGTFRTAPPANANPEILAKMSLRIDELRKIASNEITEAEFEKLPNY
jgi:uncharacterized protein